MLRPARRFLQLSGSERKLVMAAALALAKSIVALNVHGFRWCYKRGRPVSATCRKELGPHPNEVARAVKRASNGLRVGTCLTRSLALRDLLHKHGYRTDLRIGVDKGGPGFRAHAWLELDGSPVGERISPEYTVIAALK